LKKTGEARFLCHLLPQILHSKPRVSTTTISRKLSDSLILLLTASHATRQDSSCFPFPQHNKCNQALLHNHAKLSPSLRRLPRYLLLLLLHNQTFHGALLLNRVQGTINMCHLNDTLCLCIVQI
jgi:hypothetical protein